MEISRLFTKSCKPDVLKPCQPNQAAVRDFMQSERPDVVILAVAKIGGNHANNTYPADFIFENLMIECNVIHQAFAAGVTRLLQLGSSCIYPKLADQPMAEDALLTGTLEPTNEPYAVAKIAGIKLCESYNRLHGTDYRSVMPTNLYGPGDNFHPENSHVLPALIRRVHEAVENGLDTVTIWGTGSPRREFLHVDDMADASLFVLDLPQPVYDANANPMLSNINVGSGRDISILELAQLVADIAGFTGKIATDPSKPDATPRKLMDVTRLPEVGWSANISLREGITQTYDWFKLLHISDRRASSVRHAKWSGDLVSAFLPAQRNRSPNACPWRNALQFALFPDSEHCTSALV